MAHTIIIKNLNKTPILKNITIYGIREEEKNQDSAKYKD